MTLSMEQTSLPFVADRFDNASLGAHLGAIADALEAGRESVHRVRAFRAAAVSVANAAKPVAELGRQELEEIPGVGPRIAGVILDHVAGRSGMLERLHRHVRPSDHLTLLDGVGETLADRIRETLGAETLEALETQIDRLEEVEGVGRSKAERIRESLEARLARRRQPVRAHRNPPVRLLLEVDEHYRQAVAEGSLPRFAPRRNNPSGERWLPILRTELEGWSFRAMFSNSDLAHDLGRTDDWVVVLAEREGEESRATIVTEKRGRLSGQRVVRGREGESRRHHLDRAVAPASHAA
ncbi:MAG: DNA-binding protein [Deltaproteobacteria bacterium]|nr:DNA-binding protein [Deltaproteobacteria bacterium]